MKLRNLLVTVAGASLMSASLFAAVSKGKAEWGNGPVKWLMTAEEQATWKSLKSDEEADDFAKLFWARRDPSPSTEQNENREAFDNRVAYADKQFAARKTKGSLTDRGMVLIVVGPPKSYQQSGDSAFSDNQSGAGLAELPGGSDTGGGFATTMGRNSPTTVFVYEKESIPRFAPGGDFNVTFVDKNASRDYKVEPVAGRISVKELIEKGRASWIARPNLTLADLRTPARMEAATIAAPENTPAAMATSFKAEALASAVTSFKSAATSPYKGVHANYGEFVTGTGEYFVPVQLYFSPGSGVAANTPVTFFGQVEDSTGKVVAVYEEPATLAGSKSDVFYDRSLTLPSGKYTGYFGAADQSGKVIGLARTNMELSSIDKSAPGVSGLILTTNLYALPKAQLANDPFAFGGLKVVPKGDRTFSKATDELDYFIELRNPGIDPSTSKPSVTAKITITDDKGNKMTGAPAPADVQEVKGVSGHYWIGSGYPLDTFKPGKYTMDIQLTDKITGSKYDLKEAFTIIEK